MFITSTEAERAAVLTAARSMCAAARTAPKAKGQDYIVTAIATEEDKERIAVKMEEIGAARGAAFFARDAGNLRASQAVVLIGTKKAYRGLDRFCGLCGFAGCGECETAGSVCVFDSHDLGVAVGSAVSVAADMRMDSRVMFSVGRAVMELGLLPGCAIVMGIPISVSGKSPFFDRK